MKMTLQLPIDSAKPELGVIDLIESHRELFEMTGGRDQIAKVMEELLEESKKLFAPKRKVTRQMVERWFNQNDRTIPSPVLFLALLTACELIEAELSEYKKNRRTTNPIYDRTTTKR